MVYVFKTTVTTKKAIKTVVTSLDKMLFISKWNFDLSDCDNILRIESNNLDIEIICKLLNSLGFDCIELF